MRSFLLIASYVYSVHPTGNLFWGEEEDAPYTKAHPLHYSPNSEPRRVGLREDSGVKNLPVRRPASKHPFAQGAVLKRGDSSPALTLLPA